MRTSKQITDQANDVIRKHNNNALKAFWGALNGRSAHSVELLVAIILDQRCGIERKSTFEDRLVSTGDGEECVHIGVTPLISAVMARRSDLAAALLALGADPSTASEGYMPLLSAAEFSELETIQELLRQGADLEARDNRGRTVLYQAMDAGTLQVLIDEGAKVDAADSKGRTPLHQAAKRLSISKVETLLRAGASETVVDAEGRTPLQTFEDLDLWLFEDSDNDRLRELLTQKQ